MSDEKPSTIGMKPPHPGDFIRTEILDALHLSVARAAEILGVRRATLYYITPNRPSTTAYCVNSRSCPAA